MGRGRKWDDEEENGTGVISHNYPRPLIRTVRDSASNRMSNVSNAQCHNLLEANCDQGVANPVQRAVFNAKYRFKNGGCFRLAYQILKLPSSNCMTE